MARGFVFATTVACRNRLLLSGRMAYMTLQLIRKLIDAPHHFQMIGADHLLDLDLFSLDLRHAVIQFSNIALEHSNIAFEHSNIRLKGADIGLERPDILLHLGNLTRNAVTPLLDGLKNLIALVHTRTQS